VQLHAGTPKTGDMTGASLSCPVIREAKGVVVLFITVSQVISWFIKNDMKHF